MRRSAWAGSLGAALFLVAGCTGSVDDTSADTGDTDVAELPSEYRFEGRDGGDSVSYGGQVFRHLLIDDMKGHLGRLTERLLVGAIFPVAGDVEAELDFYFSFDGDTSGSLPHGRSTSPAALQSTYDDVSSGKDLVGKLAGNDPVGQHVDWATGFVGWQHASVTTPESLVRHWFDQIDAQAVAWSNGDIPLDPSGAPVPAVYVTPEGQDLQQLLEKFLRGSVAFSQGADDYLDDDEPGKGLLADHSELEDGKPFTALEHAWDEGFGYFGAARDYATWTDDEIANVGALDANGDGAIDLTTEVCWGHSVNAGKRDRGASAEAPTDLTADAWEGFARGRQLLASTSGPLSSAELEELKGYRDQAVMAWEAAIAATVVHYINDVLRDMGRIGTDDYRFGDHAKHWSELKGFALSFQFNPRSALTPAEFATLHALLGDAPALASASEAERDSYAAGLIEARALVGAAFDFDDANLGDADGSNGW